jgi:hypothetical protein
VRLYIDNKLVAKLTANASGTVTFEIAPSALHLAPGRHTIHLTSMLLTQLQGFTST